MSVVLDASAVLAFLQQEIGWERVHESISGAKISSVNASEVLLKLYDAGMSENDALGVFAAMDCSVSVFSTHQANLCAKLRKQTRHLGLSLGDRACIALAIDAGSKVLTADKAWGRLELDVEIEVIR